MWKFLLLLGGTLLVVALGLGWLSAEGGFVTLELKRDAVAAALNALASLFVIALFVERSVQVFFAGAWDEEREMLRAQLAAAQAAGDTPSAQAIGQRLIEIRGEVRVAAHIVSGVLGVLVALGGITLLSELVQTPAGVPTWQTVCFRAADIAITAGLIAGGSKVIHEIMEVITQNISRFRPEPSDDKLVRGGKAAEPPPAPPSPAPASAPGARRAAPPQVP